jgi:hypothetical protein
MNKFFIILIILLTSEIVAAQDFSDEIRFINHLQARGNLKEALFILDDLKTEGQGETDTVNFLKGWILYGQKDLETSAYYLSLVSKGSSFYSKARFFCAYNHAYLGNTGHSTSILHEFLEDNSAQIKAMAYFQLGGITLLDRKLNDYPEISAKFNGSFSYTSREEINLNDYYNRIGDHKHRSPLLAGILSTAIPGLGKIYAGKKAEGIASLLYVGALSLVTYDLYATKGITNPFFIISAGLTAVFYSGNIWGSVAAVKKTNNEFNYEINQRILFDMHIPLRILFP